MTLRCSGADRLPISGPRSRALGAPRRWPEGRPRGCVGASSARYAMTWLDPRNLTGWSSCISEIRAIERRTFRAAGACFAAPRWGMDRRSRGYPGPCCARVRISRTPAAGVRRVFVCRRSAADSADERGGLADAVAGNGQVTADVGPGTLAVGAGDDDLLGDCRRYQLAAGEIRLDHRDVRAVEGGASRTAAEGDRAAGGLDDLPGSGWPSTGITAGSW